MESYNFYELDSLSTKKIRNHSLGFLEKFILKILN